jgi:hypothetical protein
MPAAAKARLVLVGCWPAPRGPCAPCEPLLLVFVVATFAAGGQGVEALLRVQPVPALRHFTVRVLGVRDSWGNSSASSTSLSSRSGTNTCSRAQGVWFNFAQ